jgi:hypothetical protein
MASPSRQMPSISQALDINSAFSRTLTQQQTLPSPRPSTLLHALYRSNHPPTAPSLCNTKLRNLTHLLPRFTPSLVRHTPPELGRLDLLVPAPGMPYANQLRHAPALLRLQRPPRLRFQLQFVTLPMTVSIVFACKKRNGSPWSPPAGNAARKWAALCCL